MPDVTCLQAGLHHALTGLQLCKLDTSHEAYMPWLGSLIHFGLLRRCGRAMCWLNAARRMRRKRASLICKGREEVEIAIAVIAATG